MYGSRSATLRFDPEGRIEAVAAQWWFDDFYSASALAGLDRNGDGTYTTKELAPLRDEMWSAFPEQGYFTVVTADGKPARYGHGIKMALSVDGTFLKLDMVLPLATALDPRSSRVELRTLDVTYYVAMDLVPDDPVHLDGAVPSGCRAVIEQPQDDDEQTTLSDNLASNKDLARTYAMNAATAIRIACS